MDSTAELLFNISANADDAQANLEKFRTLMGEDLAFASESFEQFGETAIQQQLALAAALDKTTASETAQVEATEALAAAHGHAVSEIQATSGAIRLLEGSGGIRAMERFTATTLGLGPAMQAIFPIVGALAFAEIIGKMGEKVYDMVQKWNPVVQAEQRATDTAKALQAVIERTGEAIRKLDAEALVRAIGKPAATIHEADQLLRTSIQADRNMMAGLQLQIADAEKAIKDSAATDEIDILREAREAAQKDLKNYRMQLSAFQMDLEEKELQAQKLGAEGAEAQIEQNKKAAEVAKKTKDDYLGLTGILESLRTKVASYGSAWDKLHEEVARYNLEITKAQDELVKLERAGNITTEARHREIAALAQIPSMLRTVIADATAKIRAAETEAWGEAVTKSAEASEALAWQQEKAGEARVQVEREIAAKLATSEEEGYAQQRARFMEQQNAWAESLAKKTELTAADWLAMNQITMEGLAKIDRTETGAWQQELGKMKEHLDSLTAANQTAQQKIRSEYQKSLQQETDAEDRALEKIGNDEAKANQIRQMYAQMRTQLTQRYQNELNTLLNSSGFQGTFGSYFGSLLKGDEQAMRQWAQSSNQSLSLLSMTFKILKADAKQAFETMLQGMGSTIAQAIVASKSVTQAMEKMLASTLESFAGQALTAAIMATAWGFLDLAIGADAAAANAFTSAAIFGTVGAGAAIAGRMLTPSSASPGGGSSGSGGGYGTGGSTAGGDGSAGGSAGGQQPNVYVNVEGHVIGPSGAAQLCDIINQAVFGNQMTLYASHSRNGVPLG